VRDRRVTEAGGVAVRHSGAMRSIEPGISRFNLWIPGPMLTHRPGM